MTNTGSASLLISRISTTGNFAESNTCSTQLQFQASATCQISVTFTPTAAGPRSGTLTIADNAADSPQTAALSGNPPAASFSISPAPGSASMTTVTAGQTASYSLALGGTNGFSGQVQMSCTGAPTATCSVSPNPVTVSGTTPASVTVSAITQARSTNIPSAWRFTRVS
jgi:hypothetical protein